MGAWGYGLFQSDTDLDVAGEISSDAAALAGDPELDLLCPENPTVVIAQLNNGLLDKLLTSFMLAKWDHGVVYLGALALQLGAKISVEQNILLRKTLKRTPMYAKANAQMQRGLVWCVKNEGPFDFQSPGVLETIMTTKTDEPDGKQAELDRQPPFTMLNVMEDWSKMPRPKPKQKTVLKENRVPEGGDSVKKEGKEVKTEAVKVKMEDNQGQLPTGKDCLRNKAALQAWFEDVADDDSI